MAACVAAFSLVSGLAALTGTVWFSAAPAEAATSGSAPAAAQLASSAVATLASSAAERTGTASGLPGSAETAILVAGVVILLVLAVFLGRRISHRARSAAPASNRAPGGNGPHARNGAPGGNCVPDANGAPGRSCAASGSGGRRPTPRNDLQSPDRPSAEQLETQASRALAETDDAVRTSAQELGFATARFGEQDTAPFSAALSAARAELGAAFRLRQLLDDSRTEDDATRRSQLTEIGGRCAEANRLLDEQSGAFDQLQDLEARAPEMMSEVDARIAEQTARIATSYQILGRLATRYTGHAIAAVAASPGQAAERLDFASAALARAKEKMGEDQAGQAAVLLQAAESGAGQAADLLDAVRHAEAELTQAASALPAALREVDAEIAEATALLAGRPGDERAALVERAQATAAQVRTRQGEGPFDALAALRDVQQADAALDHALVSVRSERDREDRARAVLDQTMLVARSSVTAAGDFIATRRGAICAQARTRLAEAQRHFQQAIGCAQGDPETAVTEAQQADALAQQASGLAEHDVTRFGDEQTRLAWAGWPGFDAGLGGAILGGIVIGGQPGGGHGAGGQGAGIGTRGTGPGSFGGIRTRGRHSAAGRL